MITLSSFSIRSQILIGTLPVFITLVFLAFSSFQNFKVFEQSFENLGEITKENLTFLEIERDMVELQRNVAVYSYVGYRGVVRKIEFLQNNLESKFQIIKPIALKDEEIKDRFERMLGHYFDYKEGFLEVIEKRIKLRNLSDETIGGLFGAKQDTLLNLGDAFKEKQDFRSAYIIAQMQKELADANNKMQTFQSLPDSVLVKESRLSIAEILRLGKDLKTRISDQTEILEKLDVFLLDLEKYKGKISEISRVNSIYSHLVNVVLAGKAAEIDKLSDEIDVLIRDRYEDVSRNIQSNRKKTQQQFIILALVAVLLGFLMTLIVASGIANPVHAMAKTLSSLAQGNSDVEIPGQKRDDEVGEMAKAANEFKIMANDLESQSAELEEFAYRTSHDLRSPLVSSIGVLDIALHYLKEGDSKQVEQSLVMVRGSLKKLETLVLDILELTKTKNVAEDFQDINFQDIVDDVIQNFSYMDNFARLDIQKSFSDDIKLRSQKSRIHLIIENLLSNAIKYQDNDKENSFVKISTYYEGENAIFEIEDNGLGIGEDYHNQMFTMFKRFHPRVSFGSGLGLYMMKKSADVIEADIVYEDTGHGSKFKLVIPQNKET